MHRNAGKKTPEKISKKAAGIKKSKLSANTQVCYLKQLKVVFRRAIEDEIIFRDTRWIPSIKILSPKEPQRRYLFLTIDEVKTLMSIPTPYDEVKSAYLFSCYTGLRFSDIKGLTWGRIREINHETMLIYVQQKTGKQEYLSLAKPALDLLKGRARTNDDDLIFDLPANSMVNERLKRIAQAAGIENKKVTFHTARHSDFYFHLKMSRL